MATRKPAKQKTSAEMKIQLEVARKRLSDLEKRAYAEELTELIGATNIAEDFAKIQARITDVKPTAILAAIGAIVGIKRLKITQTDVTTRKTADPTKLK